MKSGNTDVRFQTGVKTSSVHMQFHFGCISKQPDKTRNEFQTQLRIKCNIQSVFAYSFYFG